MTVYCICHTAAQKSVKGLPPLLHVLLSLRFCHGFVKTMGVARLKSYIIVHGMYVAARSRNEYASSAILSLCKYRLTRGYKEYTHNRRGIPRNHGLTNL